MNNGDTVKLDYQSGFGNEFATEALPGALPEGQNSPQRPPYGLYAELVSGTAFTQPRNDNLRTWLYRLRPSAVHGAFSRIDNGRLRTSPFDEGLLTPQQMRWDPTPVPDEKTDLISGMMTIGANGDANARRASASISMRRTLRWWTGIFIMQTGKCCLCHSRGDCGL